MIWWLFFIIICYSIIVISFIIGFDKVLYFEFKNYTPKTTFSVIVPFRNEAEKLPFLLQSIDKLNYPKDLFEFIFIDDASSDSSVKLISETLNKQIQYRIIRNKRSSNSPKKDAITTAISKTKNNWILTTDADCILPKNWLNTFNGFIQKNQPKMVVAPVSYQTKNTFFEQFQLLDFLSLQGVTIGGFGIDKPFLCNGANLAYQKELFLQLNGFEGNNNIASGDDIFLFEKFIKNNSKNVQFLKAKEAIVQTFPVKTLKDLVHQRVRWAAKSANYQLGFGKLVGSIVFLTNFSLLIFSFLAIFQQAPYQQFLLFFTIKLLLDFILFYKTSSFFHQQKAMYQWFFPSSLLYPFFSVFVVLKSIFFNYQWKGRRFKK